MMTKDELFEWLCEATAVISDGAHIYSITHIAKCTGNTEYRIRKLMHELRDDGLVERDYWGGLSDWDWMVHCYHGWSLTEKALDTELYKEYDKKAIAEMNEFLNGGDDE